jgi:DNA-binding PadR family transcriptional regulator
MSRRRHHSLSDEFEHFAGMRHARGGRGAFGGGAPFGPPFGPPFGRGFGGGRGGGRGRARRGEVRAALLLLLAEEPRNGYQMMQEIEERSGGRWRPSPGSVYPSLSQLEDEGLIRSVEQDGAKLFEITDAGRAHLEERHSDTAPWEAAGDDPDTDAIHDVRQLIGQVAAAAMQVAHTGDEGQRTRATETLSETRRTLYRILADDPE